MPLGCMQHCGVRGGGAAVHIAEDGAGEQGPRSQKVGESFPEEMITKLMLLGRGGYLCKPTVCREWPRWGCGGCSPTVIMKGPRS